MLFTKKIVTDNDRMSEDRTGSRSYEANVRKRKRLYQSKINVKRSYDRDEGSTIESYAEDFGFRLHFRQRFFCRFDGKGMCKCARAAVSCHRLL